MIAVACRNIPSHRRHHRVFITIKIMHFRSLRCDRQTMPASTTNTHRTSNLNTKHTHKYTNGAVILAIITSSFRMFSCTFVFFFYFNYCYYDVKTNRNKNDGWDSIVLCVCVCVDVWRFVRCNCLLWVPVDGIVRTHTHTANDSFAMGL